MFTNAEVNGSSTMRGRSPLEHYRSIVEAIANREGTRASARARTRPGRPGATSPARSRTAPSSTWVPGASLLRLSVPHGCVVRGWGSGVPGVQGFQGFQKVRGFGVRGLEFSLRMSAGEAPRQRPVV